MSLSAKLFVYRKIYVFISDYATGSASGLAHYFGTLRTADADLVLVHLFAFNDIVCKVGICKDRPAESRKIEISVIDVSCGRRTRAVIVTDSDHVILSAIQAETITNRLYSDDDTDEEDEDEE